MCWLCSLAKVRQNSLICASKNTFEFHRFEIVGCAIRSFHLEKRNRILQVKIKNELILYESRERERLRKEERERERERERGREKEREGEK